MKVGISAIFKNEFNYVLEWLAHHRVLGVDKFFIADNVSNDGTSQLLEALDELGIIKRIYAPRVGKMGPQVPAYNRILGHYGKHVDLMAFIDADEFIMAAPGVNFKAHLRQLLKDNETAAMALNWKVYGSSHAKLPRSGLVLENFTLRAPDTFKANAHIKTLVKPSYVEKVDVHNCYLNQGHYVTADYTPAEFDESSARTTSVNFNKLYINHYVVKSRVEHFITKANKGSAAGSKDRLKGVGYFLGHDGNDIEDPLTDTNHLSLVKEQMAELSRAVEQKTNFMEMPKCAVKVEGKVISGWVGAKTKLIPTIKILHKGQQEFLVKCDIKRSDIFKQKLTAEPLCGFSFVIPNEAFDINDFQLFLYGSTFELVIPKTVKAMP